MYDGMDVEPQTLKGPELVGDECSWCEVMSLDGQEYSRLCTAQYIIVMVIGIH
jgi:hypothetical protein